MAAPGMVATDTIKRLVSETCLMFLLVSKLVWDGIICASVFTVHMPLV